MVVRVTRGHARDQQAELRLRDLFVKLLQQYCINTVNFGHKSTLIG